jgi:hypothetical protein
MPAGVFVDGVRSELPDMTESVLFTAEEWEIPTPASTSIATNVMKKTL